MLSNMDLNIKSYEEVREESIARIPLYSRDWTNYNISDPGITILENLSAFTALQQSELDEVPEKVKRRLLALTGFTAQKGSCAQAYIILNQETPMRYALPPQRMKLYAQDICYELDQCAPVKEMRIVAIKSNGRMNTLLEKYGVKGGLPLFGEHPTGGERICFYLSDVPEAGQKAAVFFDIARQFPRNPFEKGRQNPFAEIRWEVLTQEGYTEIDVEDHTFCLLQEGYAVFSLDEKIHDSLVRDSDENAYVMRLTLVRAAYDLYPRVQRIRGLAILAVQRDTQSDIMVRYPQPGADNCFGVHSYLLKNGYLEVYGKEADGLYHRYYEVNPHQDMGNRLYEIEYENHFTVKLIFDEGCPPKEILAVCRDEKIMAYRSLGRLYGYDNQVIQFPNFYQIYPEDFSLLVVEKRGQADAICHVVKPENQTRGEVYYSVSESDNTLMIHDCGYYEGAELRLGNYVTYLGEGGNIRADTELVCEHDPGSLRFMNCSDVTNGRFEERFEQVRSRFAADVTRPSTLVTQKDCEQIVKAVPGLSIHKMGVHSETRQNEIHITVKPNSLEAFPRLSDTYKNEIGQYLEKYRMLTTKIVIKQPVYVPIHVTGTIAVRKHLAHDREKIEKALKKMLDGIHSEAGFGSKIVFHELYNCLRNVECVEEIYDLSIFPDSSQWAEKVGLDIQLKANALYYPGKLRIEAVR